MGDFRKKNYRADFERKNILQGNTFHKMALYVGEKTNDHRTSRGRHPDVQL